MDATRRRHKLDRLIARDGVLCHWCRQPFDFQHLATLEHLIPVTYGGSSDDSNLVLACERCNVTRHHWVRCAGCDNRVRRGGVVQEQQVWHRACLATPTVRSEHAPARPSLHTVTRALISLPRTGEPSETSTEDRDNARTT